VFIELLPYLALPLIVFGVAIAIERSGSCLGGALSSLPVISGATLIAIASNGDVKDVQLVAFSGLLGSYTTLVLLRVYAGLCRTHSPLASLVAASIAGFVCAVALIPIASSLSESSGHHSSKWLPICMLAFVSIALATPRRLWPQPCAIVAKPDTSSARKRMIIRVISGTLFGYAVMLAHANLGALVAGALVGLPFVSLPQLVIQHRLYGGESSRQLICGRNRAHGVQVTFLATLSIALNAGSVGAAFALALLLSVAYFAVIAIHAPQGLWLKNPLQKSTL
jgi:Kef-type K+ transport system membrane component KefB